MIQKLVKANSAKEAIEREHKQPVESVWIDEEWKKRQDSSSKNKNIMGF